MHRLYRNIIRPVLEAVEPSSIVEIGSDRGFNTKNLLEFCEQHDAKLHTIDPVPKYDVSEWQKIYGERFAFYEALSLDALPLLRNFDVVLIDGDHNWYTVFNELRMLNDLSRNSSRTFPLVFLHDTGWPYGRRDLYYNPENIPEPYRQPTERKGMAPGSEALKKKGGLNSHLENAVRENTDRNGVLTAIEDFLTSVDQSLDFVELPGLHGLGILVPDKLQADNPELRGLLERLRFDEFAQHHVEQVEAERVKAEIKNQARRIELEEVTTSQEALQAELESVHADSEALLTKLQGRELSNEALTENVEKLSRWSGQLEAGISALLASRQWKFGRAAGELRRKVMGRTEGPTAVSFLEEVLAELHRWRNVRGTQVASESTPSSERRSPRGKFFGVAEHVLRDLENRPPPPSQWSCRYTMPTTT